MHKRQLWPGELTEESLGGGKYTAPFSTVHQCSSVLGAQDVGQIKSVIVAITTVEFIHFPADSLTGSHSFPSLFLQVKTNPLQPLGVSSSYSHYYSNHPPTSPPPNMHIHIYTIRTKLTLFLDFVITIYHNRICIFFFFTEQEISSAN
uniref:Uncharacterized protein n=1 Tax=Myotis myotis TaxID=51298 RepID=A0A7J7WVT0_MYOMY|nr:hypothetical protein mMyoMyo1_011900 [Myotis myotis]